MNEEGVKVLKAFYKIEDRLYKNKDKPIEIISAMEWSTLMMAHELGAISWDAMVRVYGDFMSKKTGIR